MPVEIRPLHATDRVAWQGLWTEYLTFYGSSVEPVVYDTTFARLLGDDPQDYSAFVAAIDGTVVGLTHYLFHRHNWKVENVCYLQDLYASPDVRGRGIGRALIKAVYDAADANDAPSVYWNTQESNAPARLLYDQVASLTDFIKYQRPA